MDARPLRRRRFDRSSRKSTRSSEGTAICLEYHPANAWMRLGSVNGPQVSTPSVPPEATFTFHIKVCVDIIRIRARRAPDALA
jgi:hypothetical protein